MYHKWRTVYVNTLVKILKVNCHLFPLDASNGADNFTGVFFEASKIPFSRWVSYRVRLSILAWDILANKNLTGGKVKICKCWFTEAEMDYSKIFNLTKDFWNTVSSKGSLSSFWSLLFSCLSLLFSSLLWGLHKDPKVDRFTRWVKDLPWNARMAAVIAYFCSGNTMSQASAPLVSCCSDRSVKYLP